VRKIGGAPRAPPALDLSQNRGPIGLVRTDSASWRQLAVAEGSAVSMFVEVRARERPPASCPNRFPIFCALPQPLLVQAGWLLGDVFPTITSNSAGAGVVRVDEAARLRRTADVSRRFFCAGHSASSPAKWRSARRLRRARSAGTGGNPRNSPLQGRCRSARRPDAPTEHGEPARGFARHESPVRSVGAVDAKHPRPSTSGPVLRFHMFRTFF